MMTFLFYVFMYLLTVLVSATGILYVNQFTHSFKSIKTKSYCEETRKYTYTPTLTKNDVNKILALSFIPIVNLGIFTYQCIKLLVTIILQKILNIDYTSLPTDSSRDY